MTERISRPPTEDPLPTEDAAQTASDRDEEQREEGRRQTPPTSWNRERAFRFVGLGTELAGFTLVFAGLGHLIDRSGDYSKPYATALGALIGFSLGMIRFIWQVQQSNDS